MADKDLMNLSQLAKAMGISRQAIKRHIDRAGMEADAKGRYSLKLVSAYQEARKELDNQLKSLSAKERKIELECQYLQERIKIIKKDYISNEEHYQELADHGQILISAISLFREHAIAMFPDKLTLKKCQELEKLVRQSILDKLDELHESIDKKVS